MLPRFHVGALSELATGLEWTLDEAVSRHVQVLRLQPGDLVRLFDGRGREWCAAVLEMGRKRVTVRLTEPVSNDRELGVAVTLAVGMPANDRMDFVVEKATELGVTVIQPVMCERSVLRLEGERAIKKVAHWQGVAVAAAEQCGRAVVPQVRPVAALTAWLRERGHEASSTGGVPAAEQRAVLSLRDALPLNDWLDAVCRAPARAGNVAGSECDARGHEAGTTASGTSFVFLNGPEGGLSPSEEGAALACGWQAVSLGRRVLRADTAPLAALSIIGARFGG